MSQWLPRTDSKFTFDPKFPWMGAEGEGTPPPAGDGGSGNGQTQGAPAGDQGQGGTGNEDGQKQQPAAGDTVSRAEHEAVLARMQAADRAKSAAEQKIKEFEDKGKSDLERAQSEAEEARKAREESVATLQALRIENAFLAQNQVQWINPATALKLLDRSAITIEDDGTVKGLDAAVKKLAASDPYLVKTGNGDGSPSGDPKDGSKNGAGRKDAERSALERKYPVLRGR